MADPVNLSDPINPQGVSIVDHLTNEKFFAKAADAQLRNLMYQWWRANSGVGIALSTHDINELRAAREASLGQVS